MDLQVGLGPGRHDISVIFKPTQSTIVFSITRPGELASEYRVQHTRAGGFRRFSETEVVEAARKLALPFAEKVSPSSDDICTARAGRRAPSSLRSELSAIVPVTEMLH
jgi:hypothetical protein